MFGILASPVCVAHAVEGHAHDTGTSAVASAIAVLHPTETGAVKGWVKFAADAGGVKIHAELEGLTPGPHGFHIHQYGDCSSSDGSLAGGHFNPEGMPHGGPDTESRHVGDLGNIEAGEDGRAVYDRVDPRLSLSGAQTIIGRSVIVHAKVDDLTSQPAGAAGARLSCGVIGVAKQ
ncbi:MAG: superoxide dismutase [Candidatus Lindowbacteria bacterium RIFCSPLOWO2_12_FULL_62_27]|nr:MAG: superoxide dismutase [Candidatus Lindowbacteria bacterium RIFCSPLOWO2_12_FULL_62_27]